MNTTDVTDRRPEVSHIVVFVVRRVHVVMVHCQLARGIAHKPIKNNGDTD